MTSDASSVGRLLENRSAYAVLHAGSSVSGHVLVRPHRLLRSWWEATSEEQLDLLKLIGEVRALLRNEFGVERLTVGFDEAQQAAGGENGRLVVHVIPLSGGAGPGASGIGAVTAGIPRAVPPALGLAPQLIDGSEVTMKLELLRCLVNDTYDRIDLLVSFIMRSGLDLLVPHLLDALEREAVVRVLTTDYLGVTDPQALARLLDMQETSDGALKTRVFSHPATSFHPKAYLFRRSDGSGARAFVGSSNLSRSGIDGGVEWNLAIGDATPLLTSFERLWVDERTLSLDHAWLSRYKQTPRERASGTIDPIGVEIEPPVQPVSPRPIQVEALDALAQTRLDGHRAGLVVMATGLGKTWVAAFDSARPQFRRTLFVAHRDEILQQSLESFRAVRPDADLGLYTGADKQPDADVVFASVQTLTRRLHEFDPEAFDYVVVDEFHHAAARTYRRVLDHFEPDFLLGLTATPERMDGADLLALCGDNLVFQCDLVEGIRREALVPFEYHGVADVVDFEPIPWRGGRFDPTALSEAVETQERAAHAFREWSSRKGSRTLAFCCTTAHADFMAEWFRSQGIAAAAVHSGESSAPRRQSVEDLSGGRLEVLFAVDIFNEGFDLPALDTVLMLRPTDSPVIFLQQLGRGLRIAGGKDHLAVVDLIGNHRAFLLKPRTLLSLCSETTPTRKQLLDSVVDPTVLDLPPGCSVTWDLDVIDFYKELLRRRGDLATDALREYVLSYTDEHGSRPTAMQAFRAGLNPGSARGEGGWYGLLEELSVLTERELAAVVSAREVLRQLEAEPLTRSFKLVTLRALLHDDALRTGTTVERVAEVARHIVTGDPRLVADATAPSTMPDPVAATELAWREYWRKNPLAALSAGGKSVGDPLFRIEGDRFDPTFSVPDEFGEDFDELVAELIEYRLARYLLRPGADSPVMHLRVSHADGRPILFLDRTRWPDTPEGWTTVVAAGSTYELNFVKVAANVARRQGEDDTNVLPELLRSWFGDTAGHPGTSHVVTLRSDGSRWVLDRARAADQSKPMKLQVDGMEIDAAVTIELGEEAGELVVTVESSGGTKGSANARNHDYVRAVDVVLERAGALGLPLIDAYVDSMRTHYLTIDERRLDPGRPFPITLSAEGDGVAVRQALLRSMGRVGRSPEVSSSSGNNRKRMSLRFDCEPAQLVRAAELVLRGENRSADAAG